MNHSKSSLTEGPVFANLLRFALPILLGSIVTQLYNVADSVIVGRFVSSDALAAVSACSPSTNFINMFLVGLSTGSNVVIAQRVGAKDRDALQKALGSIACLTLFSSLLLTVTGLIITKPLLTLLGTPELIFNDSVRYMSVIFLGTTGNIVYQMGSGALRGMGDSTRPFLFLLGCSILNVVLDLAAVIFLDMGVLGVAIATAVSQMVSGIGIIMLINGGRYGVTLRLNQLKVDMKELKLVVGIGLPAAIQNVGNTIAAICVQSSVNVFGPDFIASNSIVTKVDDMINIPVVALSTALCTFVGQNMGNYDMTRIKKGINSSIASLCGLGVVMTGFIIAMRRILPRMFTDNIDVIDYASVGLFIMSFQCLFHGIDRCLVNAMRGAGKSVVPMITAQFGAFSRIPLAYFLGRKPFNFKGIFFAMLIASFLRTAAISFYYYCGGWKKAVAGFEASHGKK